MQREIKFRAWDTKKSCWVKNVYIALDGWHFTSAIDDHQPELVLMQYTGLEDKNGKEIYEGDLIELEEYGRGKVVFDEAMFQYKPLTDAWQIEENVKCHAFYPVTEARVEVIGNIYSNPTLLQAN
jgi:uncharacterized phage protein (TIGR01671 family)